MWRVILAFILLYLTYSTVFSQTPDYVAKDSLKSYWPFTSNANDSSGYNNHGIVENAVPITDRFGKANAAYFFENNNQTITLPSASFAPVDGNFTLSFWFQSAYEDRMDIFNLTDSGQYINNLHIALNDYGGVLAYWNSSGANNIMAGTKGEFTDSIWHNITLSRDSSVLQLYVDGELRGIHNDYTLPIGNKNGIVLNDSISPFKGAIDDLVIYNRALTEAEIKILSDPASLLITQPTETDAFPVEYKTEIKWLNPISVDTIKIEYSIDKGETWRTISNQTAASSRSIEWDVPYFPGSECIVKISSAKDLNYYIVSDTFHISKYRWQNISENAPFSVRDGVASYAHNDHIYLMGGWNPLDPFNYPYVTNSEVWKSENGSDWELLTIAPWEQRHTFGHLVYDNKMWVLGGDQNQGHFQPDVWNSEDGVNWNLVNANVPWGERMLHLYFVFQNKMWVMGGQKVNLWGNSEEAPYNDIWNSTDGINWTLVTDSASWSPRGQIAGHVIFNNKMWILGGGVYTKKYYNDVWNSSDGLNWELVVESAPWKGRQYHSVATFDSAMWVLGGFFGWLNGGDASDVWYSQNGSNWHHLKGTPWPPRHASTVFVFNNSLWIATGYLHNDIWKLSEAPCPEISSQFTSNTFLLDGSGGITGSKKTDAAISYQWQILFDSVWINLMDTLNITGSNNDTLYLGNLSYQNIGEQYRVLVQYENCTSISSPSTIVDVCQVIEKQPDDVTLKLTESDSTYATSFEIYLADSTAHYQWQVNKGAEWEDIVNGVSFMGSATHKLQIIDVNLEMDQWKFHCLVTTAFCSLLSSTAKLTICPSVAVQANVQLAEIGQRVEISATYPRNALGYLWKKKNGDAWITLTDNSDQTGTQTNILTIPSTNIFSGGIYQSIVFDTHCLTLSDSIRIEIVLPQANDVITNVNTVSFIIAPINLPDTTAQYTWEISYDGIHWAPVTDTINFSGINSEQLEILNATFNLNGIFFRYGIDVNGTTVYSSGSMFTVCEPIEMQPENQTILSGDDAVFSVDYKEYDAKYEWQIFQNNIWENIIANSEYTGVDSPELKISAVNVDDTDKAFRCKVQNGLCISYSELATLIVYLKRDEVTLYPNPVNNKLSIHVRTPINTAYYKLVDKIGRVMLEGQLESGINIIDTTLLASGVYIFSIYGDITNAIEFIKE